MGGQIAPPTKNYSNFNMKITVRIPTAQYAYYEIQYDSIDEYKAEHPKLKDAIKEVQLKINNKE